MENLYLTVILLIALISTHSRFLILLWDYWTSNAGTVHGMILSRMSSSLRSVPLVIVRFQLLLDSCDNGAGLEVMTLESSQFDDQQLEREAKAVDQLW